MRRTDSQKGVFLFLDGGEAGCETYTGLTYPIILFVPRLWRQEEREDWTAASPAVKAELCNFFTGHFDIE